MKTIFFWSCLLVAFFEPGMSDVYLHFPPGSNNRLNGNRENVQNNKRLFDSQNNDKAGYNVGINSADRIGNQEEDQLPLEFYMSGCNAEAKSEVDIMWTNQHGTGPNTDDRVESQIILQYMRQDFPEEIYPNGKLDGGSEKFAYHTLRNGESTATTGFADRRPQEGYATKSRGLHEPFDYYQTCYRRVRNQGLFIADQALRGKTAIHTRQNPAGTRRGYECPEERDYYPYWAPTPWKDIAIMVSDKKTLELMKKYVNSPEYGYKYLCIMPSKLAGNKDCPLIYRLNIPAFKCAAKEITSKSCKEAGGTWTRFVTNYIEKSGGVLDDCGDHDRFKTIKGLPYEPHLVTQGTLEESQYLVVQPAPEVIYAPSTVVNHNGMNMEGKFSSYKWKIPCFPTNTTQRIVFRIRYNITTDDAPREFTAKDNKKVNNNPQTKATDGTILQLALNTAQLSRTFQDRSHVIILKPRSYLPKEFQNSNIYYIGGMGKRGNIVQTYPAMEYRFHPERISVTTNDVICFVWSGSNTNPANNAGEGTRGTDRTNVCWVKEGCSSLQPKACSNLPLEVVNHVGRKFTANQLNSHLNKGCYTGSAKLQDQLNNAPASCNSPCFRIKKPGEYCYMGTRNNNFSNRRHMGQITVTKDPK